MRFFRREEGEKKGKKKKGRGREELRCNLFSVPLPGNRAEILGECLLVLCPEKRREKREGRGGGKKEKK